MTNSRCSFTLATYSFSKAFNVIFKEITILSHSYLRHLHHTSLNCVITIKRTTGTNKFGNSDNRLCKHPTRFGRSRSVYRLLAFSIQGLWAFNGSQKEYRESLNVASWLSEVQIRELLLYILQCRPCILYLMASFQGA